MIDFEETIKLKPITKEGVLSVCFNTEDAKKKCFAKHSGLQRNKSKPTFSLPSQQTFLKNHFENQTNLDLFLKQQYGQYFRFVDAHELSIIEAWEQSQGTNVYITDCLSGCVALDYNFVDNLNGQKTTIGDLEERAKHKRDIEAISQLANLSSLTLQNIKAFAEVDMICAVPANPSKEFDLPRELAAQIACISNKQDITSFFVFGTEKQSIKNLSLSEKWDAWESTSLSYKGPDIKRKNILLIDDKYQSGITMQYTAMKLQQAGAFQVYGLCMVKTLKDTDNT